MKTFNYKGVIPASKSLLNRALICGSYEKKLHIEGDSQCDDVQKMRAGLRSLDQGEAMDCGSAGTTLRFLTLRASRVPGQHVLFGSQRLFSRPQQTLVEILVQLGVQCEAQKDSSFLIHSSGWKLGEKPIYVDRQVSSQFASGLLLNCWNLDSPLSMEWGSSVVSDGYWQMSLALVRSLGMKVVESSDGIAIPAQQKIESAHSYQAESDLSSAFAVAALGLVGGSSTLLKFPKDSLQPDREFVDIIKAMGADIHLEQGKLTVNKGQALKGIDWNLINCPDLFPVLSVVCALAEGPSRLAGAPHLVHKESDRLNKSAELVRAMGRSVEILSDGMTIHGRADNDLASMKKKEFDTDHDHRLAFAATLAELAGLDIQINGKEVVNKSFPEFWEVVNEGISNGCK